MTHDGMVSFEECVDMRNRCRVSWRNMILAALGMFLPILAGLVGYAFLTGQSQAERDTRQEERIEANERHSEENFRLVRADLQEIKAMLKER